MSIAINEKAFKIVCNTSAFGRESYEARAIIEAYEAAKSEGQPIECYSPEFIEQCLLKGKSVECIVEGMTYNLTGTHLKDILQNYRTVWEAKAIKRDKRELITRPTRYEVIDHRKKAPDFGRVNSNCVEFSYQDNGRTLKVFLSDTTQIEDGVK